MSVSIIELDKNNIVQSAEIIRQSFKTVAEQFGLAKENAPTNAAFLHEDKLLDDYMSGIKIYGLFENNKQVGFMALKQKDRDTFYLEKLAVLPEHRHKGFGKLLLDYAKSYVKSANGSNISIGIIYENKELLDWYKKYGFTVIERK